MTPMNDAASLTAGLLARKGDASPAAPSARERLKLVVAAPQAVRRRKEPRVSLRLDDGRLLKLRLIAAHLGTTRQELLVRAFDEFLSHHMPNADGGACHCLGGAGQSCQGAGDERCGAKR